MTTQGNPWLTLVIPTLEERSTLEETLKSVAHHADAFGKIIVSVNGVDQKPTKHIVLQYLGNHTCDAEVYCTGRRLSATKHGQFICETLKATISLQSYVCLLADDDLLSPYSSISEYADSVMNSSRHTVGTGSFMSFKDGESSYQAEIQRIAPGEAVSTLDFLARNHKHGFAFTNISSMIVPCHVMIDCVRFMAVMRSSGRRTEYILATHRSISRLYRPATETALIRSHESQEGRVLSYLSCVYDELVYVLWVWINQPQTRPWKSESKAYGLTCSRVAFLVRELTRITIKEKIPVLYIAAKPLIALYLSRRSVLAAHLKKK